MKYVCHGYCLCVVRWWGLGKKRFLSDHPNLGFVISFIAHIIPVYLFPFIPTVDLLAAPDLPVAAVTSVVFLLLDPLFLYAPLIERDTKCLVLDHRLKITALVFRSLGDLHYLIKIYEGLQDCRRQGCTLKKMSWLAIDTLAVLPIPQVAVLVFLPKMRGSNSLKTMKVLTGLIVLQYLPRGLPICQLCSRWNRWIVGGTGYQLPNLALVVELPNWSSIVPNLYGYLVASHICGAFWYFFSIQREIECWEHACKTENGCEFSTSCVQNTYRNITLLKNLCPINPPDKQVFDFGIFSDALQYGIQGSTNFSQKWLRCFAWGIRNLSSFGSNLGDASAYGWENLFVVLMLISGLLLFMYFFGHMETFMQGTDISNSIRWKMEKTIEPKIQLMLSEYGLPTEMKSKLKRLVKAKLKEDLDLIVENMFSILSDLSDVKEAKDLAMEIKCSLFMDKLKKVDGLKDKGQEVLKKICEHLEPMIYGKDCYIIREREPLVMMFFVTGGSVLTFATNSGGSNGSSSTIQLEEEKDGLYGEDLLTWAERPSSKLSNLPISAITVKSYNKVEVFALQATDLQNVL